MRNKIIAISFATLLPVIVAVGAYQGTVITPLLLIAAVCVVVILVALGKVSGRITYLYLFGLSLGLVWQTTMLGVDVVGSDIHAEFYFAKLNVYQAWDSSYPSADNTSLVVGVIAPLLSKLLMLDMLWIFKAVLPIFLAFVPIVMFSVFKRQFGETRAFFAIIFFMIIPVYSMEVASIAKSMVAELFFALMVWVMVSNWKWQYKIVGIVVSLAMQAACHYTVVTLGICFLFGMFLVRLCSSPLKWGLFANRKVSLWMIAVCLIMGCGTFWGYHNHVGGGMMWRTVISVGVQNIPEVPDFTTVGEYGLQTTEQEAQTTGQEPQATEQESQATPADIAPSEDEGKKASLIGKRATLVELAIGRDFIDMPISGKIFRIVQFLTQLMIILGVARLIWSYKRYNVTAEFVGFVAASCFLIMFCILTTFAGTLNMTRLYHISLFFLSPMFILGCEAITSIGRKNG